MYTHVLGCMCIHVYTVSSWHAVDMVGAIEGMSLDALDVSGPTVQ